MRILTSQQMKLAEAASDAMGVTYLQLMENAGYGAFNIIAECEGSLEGKQCTVICGKGNNGGDGFVVARFLAKAGARVTCIASMGEPAAAEAKEMYSLMWNEELDVLGMDTEQADINLQLVESDIIVDALFGTGFKGRLPDKLGYLAEISNISKAKVYSLDLPSGMNADTGEIEGRCFAADVTISFACLKPAHLEPRCQPRLGKIILCGIGMPEKAFDEAGCTSFLIDKQTVFPLLKRRSDSSYKGSYGKLLSLCGSYGMIGAATLAAKGASMCGTGLVYSAVPKSAVTPLACRLTEQIILPLDETESGTVSASASDEVLRLAENMSAMLIGCGLRCNDDTSKLVHNIILNTHCPLVLDADGINAVSRDTSVLKGHLAPIVLTPHYGELSRLCGKTVDEVIENRTAVAKELAQRFNAVIVVKGSATVIAAPSGRIYYNITENSGLAKGGSGDLLAGFTAGFLAQGYPAEEAAVCAVYVHSAAALLTAKRLSKTTMQPSDVLDDLHQIFRELDE